MLRNQELSFLGYLMNLSSELAAALVALPTICKEARLQKACVGQSTAFVFGREGTKKHSDPSHLLIPAAMS